jgi:hypothetical protein
VAALEGPRAMATSAAGGHAAHPVAISWLSAPPGGEAVDGSSGAAATSASATVAPLPAVGRVPQGDACHMPVINVGTSDPAASLADGLPSTFKGSPRSVS